MPGLGDRYELASVVYCQGRGAAGARFHCVVKCDDARWWRFEDGCLPRVFRGEVERSELRSVEANSAYFLREARQGLRW